MRETGTGQQVAQLHDRYMMMMMMMITFANNVPILSNILLSNLTPCAEEIVGDHQCGF
jgi:hypothetical protein